jgi:hypothetical protein
MTAMDRTQTDRILRWIERALVALGSVCLIWVGAISMHALTYQVKQNARLARLGPSSDHLAVDRSRDAVAQRVKRMSRSGVSRFHASASLLSSWKATMKAR